MNGRAFLSFIVAEIFLSSKRIDPSAHKFNFSCRDSVYIFSTYSVNFAAVSQNE
jgi:hypothetical protein